MPEQAALPINTPQPNADIAIDRTDIDVPINPLASTTALHIEKLLSIRARHKAPKALITDLLAYIHESFPDAPGVSELPTTWQQCEQAIQHVKPVFIKVRTHTRSHVSTHAHSTSHIQHRRMHIPHNDSNTAARVCVAQIDGCPNECILFRGLYANDSTCIKCGEYRYLEDTIAYKRAQQLLTGKPAADDVTIPIKEKKLKYKPQYVYRYCPIIPILKSIIAHPVLSRLLSYADENMAYKHDNKDTNIVDDIHQAPIYHRFAQHFPLKKDDPVNGVCDIRIALGIGADRASMSLYTNNYS
jgi:hypothetical protein